MIKIQALNGEIRCEMEGNPLKVMGEIGAIFVVGYEQILQRLPFGINRDALAQETILGIAKKIDEANQRLHVDLNSLKEDAK